MEHFEHTQYAALGDQRDAIIGNEILSQEQRRASELHLIRFEVRDVDQFSVQRHTPGAAFTELQMGLLQTSGAEPLPHCEFQKMRLGVLQKDRHRIDLHQLIELIQQHG